MIVIEGIISRFAGELPRTAGELLPAIDSLLRGTPRENIDRRVLFRKIAGLLREVDPGERITSWEKFDPSDVDGDPVIFPLNMDETFDACKRLVNAGTMVFPITHPVFNNKQARHVLFPGHAPFSIHVPESCFGTAGTFDFRAILEARGIEHVVIKDDFGYHSGNVIPYIITPVKTVNERVKDFARRAARIVDVGGIVIDEFIGGTVQYVYKAHVFGGVIPGEVLRYRVTLTGLDGTFKSNDPGASQLLSSVDVSVAGDGAPGIAAIGQAAAAAMPFAFTSLDYVMRDGAPVIIDANSKAGSLGEVQERGGSGNPFSWFMQRVRKMAANPETIEAMREHVANVETIARSVRSDDITVQQRSPSPGF